MRAVEVNPQGQQPFEAAARLLSGGSNSDSSVGGDAASSGLPSSSRSGGDAPAGAHAQTRFDYIVSAAAAAAQDGCLAGGDVIMVDPPRKGLEADLLQVLASESAAAEVNCTAHTLVYLSCGFASFQRDVSALLQGGRWRLAALRAFEFFPGTNSLESLAVFRRQE